MESISKHSLEVHLAFILLENIYQTKHLKLFI